MSSIGSVHGVSLGTSGIKLVATDIANVEMASAESVVEVCIETRLFMSRVWSTSTVKI